MSLQYLCNILVDQVLTRIYKYWNNIVCLLGMSMYIMNDCLVNVSQCKFEGGLETLYTPLLILPVSGTAYAKERI